MEYKPVHHVIIFSIITILYGFNIIEFKIALPIWVIMLIIAGYKGSIQEKRSVK